MGLTYANILLLLLMWFWGLYILESYSYCHIQQNTNFQWKKLTINSKEYIYPIATALWQWHAWLQVLVLTWPWSACLCEVLRYDHAVGTNEGIKMGHDLPKATLKCRLGEGTRSKPWQPECTVHFGKSLLFKPSVAWSFRVPLWCSKAVQRCLSGY